MASVAEAIRVSLACVMGSISVYVILQLTHFTRLPRSVYLIQMIILILMLAFLVSHLQHVVVKDKNIRS